jgi:hypothetical protein
MDKRETISTVLSGIAGEYFVAAELSRRNYIASMTLKNTKGIDILVSNLEATKSVGIQVKTNQGRGKEWLLNQKIENNLATNLLFAFVRLNELDVPEFYIVPGDVVKNYATNRHKEYLAGTKKDGTLRKDGPMRKFADPENNYLNNWELLDQELA